MKKKSVFASFGLHQIELCLGVAFYFLSIIISWTDMLMDNNMQLLAVFATLSKIKLFVYGKCFFYHNLMHDSRHVTM